MVNMMIELSGMVVSKLIFSFLILIGLVKGASSETMRQNRGSVLLALLFGGATWIGIYTALGWVIQELF